MIIIGIIIASKLLLSLDFIKTSKNKIKDTEALEYINSYVKNLENILYEIGIETTFQILIQISKIILVLKLSTLKLQISRSNLIKFLLFQKKVMPYVLMIVRKVLLKKQM